MLNGSTLSFGNWVDVNRNALNVKTVFVVVEKIEQSIFCRITLVFNQYIKVATLIGVAVGTRSNNLNADNINVSIRTFKRTFYMLSNQAFNVAFGITFKTLQTCCFGLLCLWFLPHGLPLFIRPVVNAAFNIIPFLVSYCHDTAPICILFHNCGHCRLSVPHNRELLTGFHLRDGHLVRGFFYCLLLACLHIKQDAVNAVVEINGFGCCAVLLLRVSQIFCIETGFRRNICGLLLLALLSNKCGNALVYACHRVLKRTLCTGKKIGRIYTRICIYRHHTVFLIDKSTTGVSLHHIPLVFLRGLCGQLVKMMHEVQVVLRLLRRFSVARGVGGLYVERKAVFNQLPFSHIYNRIILLRLFVIVREGIKSVLVLTKECIFPVFKLCLVGHEVTTPHAFHGGHGHAFLLKLGLHHLRNGVALCLQLFVNGHDRLDACDSARRNLLLRSVRQPYGNHAA